MRDRIVELIDRLGGRFSAALNIDLERRVRRLGKGIGDVTANFFLRELRGLG